MSYDATYEAWERVLDALEERVRRQEAFLAGTGPEPPDEPLPRARAPIPAPLVVRVLTLMERIRDAERVAADELARLPRPQSGAYR